MWTPERIPDQRGRVAVVTGANSGLGLETARELARKGARVIMAARNLAKAEDARAVISRDVAQADIEIRELDLSCLDSVRACAEDILAGHDRLDLLINNAGVMGTPEDVTADGFELQLGVNHLGHFVLARRLLPALLRGSDARVVSVTSFARLFSRQVNPANPHLRGRYDPWRAYNQSKLANVHFAVELQRRLERTDASVASLAAHPGLSHTDLQARSVRDTQGGRSQRFFHGVAGAIGTPAKRGAQPVLRAATDPEARGGELYGPRWGLSGPPDRRLLLLPPGRAVTARLWALSERETGEMFDVVSIVGETRSP